MFLIQSSDPPDRPEETDETKVVSLPKLPAKLESYEQNVLQEIKRVVGDESVSEFQLQLAPQLVLFKSIAKEKADCDGAYEEVYLRSLPKNANIMYVF